MKNELDHFRKFSLTDYSVNLKKFKEYLDYCRKNNLAEEKLFILENLVNLTNEKSQSGVQNTTEVLKDLTHLCVLVVLFSDFEIENFFKIQGFTFNFQKRILFEAITHCLDRNKDQHYYIYSKFQFWVVKLTNLNISSTGEVTPITLISNEELNESLQSLSKIIEESKKEKDISVGKKIFYIKISFELGYYYYLTNDMNKMRTFFLYSIENMDWDEKEQSSHFKSVYFTKEEIVKLVKMCEKYKFLMSEGEDEMCDFIQDVGMDVEMDLDSDRKINFNSDSNIVENDFEQFFNKVSIDQQAKIIIDKYSIDDFKTLELFTIEELIKYSKNLIFLSFKNVNRLQDAKIYISKTEEIINQKIGNTQQIQSDNEKRELNFAKKENVYHSILISLIESVYEGKLKLKKNFLVDLSKTILTYTMTDDMEISCMIHGLIINFTQSFKSILNYFGDFVEFFQRRESQYSVEMVHEICFISSALKIINTILFITNLVNTNNNTPMTITGPLHNDMFNFTFFWLDSLKDKKTNKNDNILFMLIRTIKNSNFLLVLKIIYLSVLKFVIEKKNISSSTNDEIFDQIYKNNPNFYKIETLINENKNNEKFSNLNIMFKEDFNLSYKFDGLNLDFFEEVLFKLVKKVEARVVKYAKFSELELLERRNNLLFFEFKSSNGGRIEGDGGNNSQLNISAQENLPIYKDIKSNNSGKIIQEYIKYFKTKFQTYKVNFHRIDCFENIKLINEYYSEFKKNLDEVIILRMIYILTCLGKNIDASILLQYIKQIDYDLAYKLLKKNIEFHNIDKLEYIWKISYFELLANIYHSTNKFEHLSVVSNLIKRTSNHQYFKRHPLRKLFKILNFFKFIENL